MVHLYFQLRSNVQNTNSPEVEKSSGPFETSLKETSLDFPNKAFSLEGKINLFTLLLLLLVEKTGIPTETEHAKTTLTFIKEILTLNDKYGPRGRRAEQQLIAIPSQIWPLLCLVSPQSQHGVTHLHFTVVIVW